MSGNTKKQIMTAAIKLFNKKGFNAVNLFEIAGQIEISRGNLTYHFKDKVALLEEISNEMWEKLNKERNKSRQLPSFENLHNEVQLYQKFQKKYAFIFLDNKVLNHPLLKSKFKKMIEQTIKDNEAALAFAIEAGNLKPEPFKGIYRNLAFNSWMIAFFWSAQKNLRGEKNPEDAEVSIWSMLLPHFTEKGIQSFKSYFGATYLNKLGAEFDSKLDNYINF